MSDYVILNLTSHPLSCRGKVGEHRVVLYKKIGPGTHKCNWCGVPVVWLVGNEARRARTTQRLVADHLDFDKSNNDPENLVSSCLACNTTRSENGPAAQRVLRSEVWRSELRGSPWLKMVLECGHIVIRRKHRPQRAFCAVCAGEEEREPPAKRIGLGADVVRALIPDGGYESASLVGPLRRVRKELGYAPSQTSTGYRYRYLLECGHETERSMPNRTMCGCAGCVSDPHQIDRSLGDGAPAVRRTYPPRVGSRREVDINEATALASDLRANGMRLRKIAYVLNERGLKTRTGLPFDESAVHALLK